MPNYTNMQIYDNKFAFWNWRVIGPIVVAGFLLLVANSAIWVNSTLFNSQKFTSVATTALLSESSRYSIASAVVDQALADKPIAQRLVSQPATKFVTGLLDSSLAQKATEKAVSKLQTAVTTPNPENIEVDLTGVKSVASKLIALAGSTDARINEPQRELPDKIVLLDASDVPNLYKYGQAFLWLAPLAGLVAITILAYPHIKVRRLVRRVMLIQGITIILFGMLALSVGPLFRPQVLANVNDSNARVVVENIYNGFIETFNSQTSWLFVIGGLLIAVPTMLWIYSNYRKSYIKRK